MQESSLVHSEMITGRTREERTSCTHLLASYPSTVTRAFGERKKNLARNRLGSQTPHVLQGQKFHAELTRYGASKKNEKQQHGTVFLPHVNEWLVKGHEHALLGQARAAVRWLQKRAQVSRVSEVVLCVFFWSFCIAFSEKKKSCRPLLRLVKVHAPACAILWILASARVHQNIEWERPWVEGPGKELRPKSKQQAKASVGSAQTPTQTSVFWSKLRS